jgi:hypothetical protein
MINLGFLTKGKLAAILITPSSWGSQRAGHSPRIMVAQALGKLLSEKPPFVDGMINSLGRIWCPLKGIRIKEMGNNVFLFTFLQTSGKSKVLDEGPWMFNKELLVIQDFDTNKALEDYEFN